MTQPSSGPSGNSAPSARTSSSVRSFTSSCSVSRCTVAPASRARARIGRSRARASARPAAPVRGTNCGERAVGLTDTLTRGTTPHGSRSSCRRSGHERAAVMSASRVTANRPAYRSASPPVTIFSPRRSTVAASPARQSRASRGSASSGAAPAISCCAMRVMFRRAAAAVTRAPKGTCSATSSPSSSGTPAKYSSRWRMTSTSSRHAGKTSTKRKSAVLNRGWAMAHASIRSLHQPRWKTRAGSAEPASAIRRASACTSRSCGGASISLPFLVRRPGAIRSRRGDDTPVRDSRL